MSRSGKRGREITNLKWVFNKGPRVKVLFEVNWEMSETSKEGFSLPLINFEQGKKTEKDLRAI